MLFTFDLDPAGVRLIRLGPFEATEEEREARDTGVFDPEVPRRNAAVDAAVAGVARPLFLLEEVLRESEGAGEAAREDDRDLDEAGVDALASPLDSGVSVMYLGLVTGVRAGRFLAAAAATGGGDSTAAMAASAANARADLVRVRVERELMVAAGSLRPPRHEMREKCHSPQRARAGRENGAENGLLGEKTGPLRHGTAENGPRGGAAVLGRVSEDIGPFQRGKRRPGRPERPESLGRGSRGERPVGNGGGRWRGGCRGTGTRNPAVREVG